MPGALTVIARSPEETRILGAALAPVLLPGDVISLSGDLGAGKTVFVQGLAAALGVSEQVTSPTFTIVNEYEGRYRIVHMDVYRLNSFQEVIDLGFDDLFDPDGVMVVEWGEAVAPLLPPRHLDIEMNRAEDPDAVLERVITFRPRGREWSMKLDSMRRTAEALLDAASPEEGSGARFMQRARPQARDDSAGGTGSDLEA